MKNLLIITGLFSFILTGCWSIEIGQEVDKIAPGTWRGVFMIGDNNIPVLFDVKNTDNDKKTEIVFEDGTSSFQPDSIRFWGDTIFMYFEKQKTHLKLAYEISLMQGFLIDETGGEYPMVFHAQNAILHRFPDVRKTPTANLTGDWNLTINAQDTVGQGRLKVITKGNVVSATLTVGDVSINLNGTIQADKLYLSGFNGKNVCLLSADVADQNVLNKGNLIINNESFFCTASRQAGLIE